MTSAAPPSSGSGGQPPDLEELVLRLVERVPPGRATTYGAVAAAVREVLGRGGPRQVGSVLARSGGGVPWWRVVRADGSVAPGLVDRAAAHHRAEGVPARAPGVVDLARAGWVPGPEDLVAVTRG